MTDIQTVSYAISLGQRRRIAQRWKVHIPDRPDPEVLALCDEFFMPYGRGKMLKALSFGVFVDLKTLTWCCSLPAGDDEYHRHEISHQITEIKDAVGRLPVVHVPKLGYCIRDDMALARIRGVMRRSWE